MGREAIEVVFSMSFAEALTSRKNGLSGGGCAGGGVPLGAGPCCPDVGRCLSGVNIIIIIPNHNHTNIIIILTYPSGSSSSNSSSRSSGRRKLW